MMAKRASRLTAWDVGLNGSELQIKIKHTEKQKQSEVCQPTDPASGVQVVVALQRSDIQERHMNLPQGNRPLEETDAA